MGTCMGLALDFLGFLGHILGIFFLQEQDTLLGFLVATGQCLLFSFLYILDTLY